MIRITFSNPISFLAWAAGAALAAGTLAAAEPVDPEAAPGRPNFVLIIGDDISFDDFGCYGNPHIKTPNVDRLAAGGMRFTNGYLTTSQCSPTRCSLITGRYPHNTGAPELHMPLPEGQVMFPALLKQVVLAAAPEHREALGRMRALLDEWQRRTGDTVPTLDQATPDRYDRRTGTPRTGRGGRPLGGIVPGQTSGATTSNDPGPR